MQGYLCSVSAPEGEGGGGRLVLDLLAPWLDRFRREHPRGTLPPRLFPVGRLDVPSVGLLFVTNDGEGAVVNAAWPPAHVIRISACCVCTITCHAAVLAEWSWRQSSRYSTVQDPLRLH
jgi:hypothetical protein